MRRRRRILWGSVGAATLASVCALGATSWLKAEPHPLPAAYSGIYNESVAESASGDALAVWQAHNADGNETLFAVTRAAGGSWSTPTEIAEPSDSTDHVAPAMDPAGNAIVAWWTVGGVFYRYHPAGGGWSDATRQLSGVRTMDPSVAYDAGGTAWVAYSTGTAPYTLCDPNSPSPVAAVHVTPVKGELKGAAVTLAPPAAPGGQSWVCQDAPYLTVRPDGSAAVSWAGLLSGGTWVALAAVRPAGGAFQPTQIISTEANFFSACDPQVAMSADGHVTAIWRSIALPSSTSLCWVDPVTFGQNVGSATYNPVSTLWTHHAPLLPGGTFSVLPWHVGDTRGWRRAIGSDAAGNVTALWLQQPQSISLPGQSPGRIVTAVKPVAGGEWSAPDSSLGGNQMIPTGGFGANLAVNDAGDAVATWLEDDGATRVEVSRTRRAGSAVWGNRQTISAPVTSELDTPDVAIDAGGDGLSAFRLGTYDDGVMHTVGYDGAGPLLTGLSVPAGATVGQDATFSVTARDVWSQLAGPVAWNFGDGGTATGANVSHRYASAGNYTVTVSATDALGNASTATGSITVSSSPPPPPPPPPPVAGITLNVAVGPSRKGRRAVTFRGTSSVAATVQATLSGGGKRLSFPVPTRVGDFSATFNVPVRRLPSGTYTVSYVLPAGTTVRVTGLSRVTVGLALPVLRAALVRTIVSTAGGRYALKELRVAAPAGSTVAVRCAPRCGGRRAYRTAGKATLVITYPFGTDLRPAGKTIEVRISRRGFAGRYISFLISGSGLRRTCVFDGAGGPLTGCKVS